MRQRSKYRTHGDYAFDGPGLDERSEYVGPADIRIEIAEDQANMEIESQYGGQPPGADMSRVASAIIRATSERMKWIWRQRKAGLAYQPPESIRNGTKSWF